MRKPILAALTACALALPLPADAETATSPAAPAAGDGVFALGRIEPEHGILHLGVSSLVNAVSGAVLRKLHVEPGDRVKAGQVLAETDTATLEEASVALHAAEVELARLQAEAAVGEEQDACSRADVAQRTSARRTRLRQSGVASDEEADVAAGDARALSGACAAARRATKAADAAVEVARARLARSQAELDRCFVRAPSDGLIVRTIRRPGEMVGLDGAIEFAAVDRMYAIAEVWETDIARVRKGQKATVTSPALAEPLGGVVEAIRLKVRKQDATGTDPAARKDARVVEVEVLLDRPEAVATLSNLQVEVLLHP